MKSQILIACVLGGGLVCAIQGIAQTVTKPTVPKPLQIQANVLDVKFGKMQKAQMRAFTNSIAFWQGPAVLMLVFRDFAAPIDKFKVDPPDGYAKLQVMVRKYNGVSFDPVTAGKYNPIVLDKSMVYPIGARVLLNNGQEVCALGSFWTVTEGGKTDTELWGDVKSLDDWKQRGSVDITEVGTEKDGRVKGRLQMGDPAKGNVAIGVFDIPVVAQPADLYVK